MAQQETTETSKRGLSKTEIGLVTSAKMDKTIVVAVTVRMKHKDYGKFVQRTKHYYAHDEKNQCEVGDKVLIVESRPLSKLKRWRLREVIEKVS